MSRVVSRSGCPGRAPATLKARRLAVAARYRENRGMSKSQYDIQVNVATRFVDDQSAPQDNRYVFAYTITIRNAGQVPARLLTRHWIITDANGRVQEVRGAGRAVPGCAMPGCGAGVRGCGTGPGLWRC